MSNPDKVTIQRLFVHYWYDFLKDPQVIKNGVRPVVHQKVERIIFCGTYMKYIEMKCTNCGYEEEMPDCVYGEEALFLKEEGITAPMLELSKIS